MFCNARTRSGRRCRRYPLAGKRRCRLHGGLSTGPIFWRGNIEAMAQGRERYIQRRHAWGLRAPGGRPARVSDWLQQAIAERAAAELDGLDPEAVLNEPWPPDFDTMSEGERLARFQRFGTAFSYTGSGRRSIAASPSSGRRRTPLRSGQCVYSAAIDSAIGSTS